MKIPVAAIVCVLLLAPITNAESSNTEFSGRAVDDETGQAVTDFATQWGLAPEDGGAIKWGYMLSTSSQRRNGEFNEQSGWQTGQKVLVRIIADGYVPQPVADEPAIAPARLTGLVVRLKRGVELRGVVLDANGKPVDQARVFLAGAQPLELTDGAPERFKGSTATTDVSGEFALRGLDPSAENRIVAASGAGLVTMVSNPPLEKDLTVRLPEPATLIVNYDIANDEEKATLRIERKTWESPDWRGIQVVRNPVVANRGKLEMTDVSPGVYDFVRMKTLRVGDSGRGILCDRRTIEIKSGETQTVNLVRPNGRSLRGEVIGLKEAGVAGAFLTVRSPEASGEARSRDRKERMLPYYDALTCTQEDNHFRTAALSPGEYTLVVEAYRPETGQERFSTGIRSPGFVSVIKVTIPEDRDPEPVKIELKPYVRDAEAEKGAKSGI